MNPSESQSYSRRLPAFARIYSNFFTLRVNGGILSWKLGNEFRFTYSSSDLAYPLFGRQTPSNRPPGMPANKRLSLPASGFIHSFTVVFLTFFLHHQLISGQEVVLVALLKFCLSIPLLLVSKKWGLLNIYIIPVHSCCRPFDHARTFSLPFGTFRLRLLMVWATNLSNSSTSATHLYFKSWVQSSRASSVL